MLQHTSAANLDRTLDLNLKAAFWLARSGLAHLEKSVAARLLFVSSIVGNRQAHTGFASYGASKAGLNGFIRQAAIELAAKKIRVNGVEPGATLTERVRSGLSEERLKTITAAIPLGRTASPDDVAAAVLFLASDDACHITGQTIVVDGGQSLGMALPGD
jgi:3-oxoacyl-[acyl-carrier protein] reductase